MMKLRKPLYHVLCLLMGVCTLSGCIEEYEADISSDDTNLLVVEGTICASKENKFILSRTYAVNTSATPSTITHAIVSVHGTDGSEYTTQCIDGYYSCWIDDLSPDVEYYLHIEMEGEVYESEPQKPLRTEKIADVSGAQSTPVNNVEILVTPDTPFDSGQANYYAWTYDQTWEVHADYSTVMYYDTEELKPSFKTNQFPARGWKDAPGSSIIVGASSNYEGQHIRRLKLYDIERTDERIFYRYSGLVHQRAISKAEYEYEVARRQASSEMGGLFTPQPSALPTNIHCLTSQKHVIGFVGCSLNTSEYRFFLNADDYTIIHPQKDDARVWLDNPKPEECLRLVNKGMYLCEWGTSSTGVVQTAWAYEYQLDVRYKGAYIEQPDFWSLQENISY